nr:proline-rich protein 36-like [Aegilops tauschii subsp. strangulata]
MSLIVDTIKSTTADQKRSCGYAPHIQMLINSMVGTGTYLLDREHLPLWPEFEGNEVVKDASHPTSAEAQEKGKAAKEAKAAKTANAPNATIVNLKSKQDQLTYLLEATLRIERSLANLAKNQESLERIVEDKMTPALRLRRSRTCPPGHRELILLRPLPATTGRLRPSPPPPTTLPRRPLRRLRLPAASRARCPTSVRSRVLCRRSTNCAGRLRLPPVGWVSSPFAGSAQALGHGAGFSVPRAGFGWPPRAQPRPASGRLLPGLPASAHPATAVPPADSALPPRPADSCSTRPPGHWHPCLRLCPSPDYVGPCRLPPAQPALEHRHFRAGSALAETPRPPTGFRGPASPRLGRLRADPAPVPGCLLAAVPASSTPAHPARAGSPPLPHPAQAGSSVPATPNLAPSPGLSAGRPRLVASCPCRGRALALADPPLATPAAPAAPPPSPPAATSASCGRLPLTPRRLIPTSSPRPSVASAAPGRLRSLRHPLAGSAPTSRPRPAGSGWPPRARPRCLRLLVAAAPGRPLRPLVLLRAGGSR